ncbi:MAG: cyclic pyranopterin monophosphate synthase MoaC [Thermoplasmata archaeon]|nr:cyclic pyranopterin monophosphate synthase MoaC [Thermoplasmata archaeon]
MVVRQRRIHAKPRVYRRAVVVGELRLGTKSLTSIRAGTVRKGNPLATGELAGLLAMKRTPELIPHCHSIGLTGSRVEITVASDRVRVEAEAESVGRTGVEMEALVGATTALLTVWDMVKYLEKDSRGLYPTARLGPVVVREKEKGRKER